MPLFVPPTLLRRAGVAVAAPTGGHPVACSGMGTSRAPLGPPSPVGASWSALTGCPGKCLPRDGLRAPPSHAEPAPCPGPGRQPGRRRSGARGAAHVQGRSVQCGPRRRGTARAADIPLGHWETPAASADPLPAWHQTAACRTPQRRLLSSAALAKATVRA
eukprot:14380381-Alexandrium_andersonii.AAC.1